MKRCWLIFIVSGIASVDIIPREGWGARQPTAVENMTNPVPFVVIHHSYIPGSCRSKQECIQAMQWMQDYHQFNHSWNDIGYSFAVGGDNKVYTGRSWSAVGAHAIGYNNLSIGICVIGDWTANPPSIRQLQTVRLFIEEGVRQGYIKEDYKLIGHRQAKKVTECPGEALFQEIKNWPHWVKYPQRSLEEDAKPDSKEVSSDLTNENSER